MKVPIAQDQFKQLGITILPAFAAALVPKCPLCWMAILRSLGLGSSISAAWLQPLTLFFLVVALAAIAYRAHRRRAYGAPILRISAAMIIYVSRFIIRPDVGTYRGGAALMGASLWNSRPAPEIAGSIPCGCSGLNNQNRS